MTMLSSNTDNWTDDELVELAFDFLIANLDHIPNWLGIPGAERPTEEQCQALKRRLFEVKPKAVGYITSADRYTDDDLDLMVCEECGTTGRGNFVLTNTSPQIAKCIACGYTGDPELLIHDGEIA